MQTIFWIMFAVTILVATFYWIKYEKEYEKNDKLLAELYKKNNNLKEKTMLLMIVDLLEEYRKDRIGSNAYRILAKISDLFFDYDKNKLKELDTISNDNKF